MKNKKIVDYILVNEMVSNTFSSKIEMFSRQIQDEIRTLEKEIKEVGAVAIRSDIVKFRIALDSRKLPKDKLVGLGISIHSEASRLSNEEIELKISEMSKELLELEIVEKPLLSKLSQLKFKLKKQKNNISDFLHNIQRDEMESSILNLINIGYVPQGGISVSNGHSYQAMVKYEED